MAGLHLDFKDIASTGISTAGLVIATSIFLQMLVSKFTGAFDRYRTLCGEYREDTGGARKESLQEQITQYYRRCRQIRVASTLLLWTELVFLLTILSTSLTVVLPKAIWIKFLAATTVSVGLVMLGIAAVMDMRENRIIADSIESEVKDFPDLPKH